MILIRRLVLFILCCGVLYSIGFQLILYKLEFMSGLSVWQHVGVAYLPCDNNGGDAIAGSIALLRTSKVIWKCGTLEPRLSRARCHLLTSTGVLLYRSTSSRKSRPGTTSTHPQRKPMVGIFRTSFDRDRPTSLPKADRFTLQLTIQPSQTKGQRSLISTLKPCNNTFSLTAL